MDTKILGSPRFDEPVPVLRPDVRLEEVEEGDQTVHFLVDSRSARRIRLDRHGLDIVALLDRPQTFQTLLDRIATSGSSVTPESLRRILNVLDESGVLDRPLPAPDLPDQDRDDTEQDSVEFVIPESLRFTCTRCGSCCVGVNIGPVSESIVRGIHDAMKELDIKTAPGKPPFFAMVPDDEEDEIHLCRTRNGACQFLDADGLCRIFRRLGPQARPSVCRLFPYRFVWSPDGVVVSLQTDCRDILRASLGQPVREQKAELRQLLRLIPKIPRVPSRISLDGETTCSYPDYLSLETEILDRLGEAGRSGAGGWTLLLATSRALLARCRPLPLTDSERNDLGIEFYTLLRDVGEALMTLKERFSEPDSRVRFHTGNLDLAVEALEEVPLLARAILSEEEGGSSRFVHLVIANFWHGREEAFEPPDLVTATAMLAFSWFLTRALALFRARQVHRFSVEPRDLVDAWISIHQLIRNPRVSEAVLQFRKRLNRVFAYRLAELIAYREELEQVDPRIDYFEF